MELSTYIAYGLPFVTIIALPFVFVLISRYLGD